jgi:glycosyltransferase involved in cell wall biosynthesis
MVQPLVTIITPSYNQSEFIRETIESVLQQDYPRIEYIIMDGGSTDETSAIVSEYTDRLTFVSEKDRGQSHAINKGIKMARGEIVSWLNSDDIILPGAVSSAVQAFRRQPSLGAVYGEGYLIDRKGENKKRFPATESFNLWKLIHVIDYILQQTVYLRREAVEEVGYINEQLNWGMDWDLLIRIGKRYEISYIPEYMGCLREYETAKSFSGGHKRFRELAKIMREHGQMRYPPGFFLYGLDTYQGILRRYLPGPVVRLLAWAAFQGYARIIHDHGLYIDGWAEKHLHYMLPGGTKRVLIRGYLPNITALAGQRLRVICNGVPVLEQAIPHGEFQLAFDCTDTNRPINIVIRALKHTRKIAKSDRRKLAYHLNAIICAERDIDRAITQNSSPTSLQCRQMPTNAEPKSLNLSDNES